MSTLDPPHRPLSRSTSRASARSRNSSTLSRNQSLIKKNIELQDLKPADVLIERFVAWKAIVKQLTAYFEGIADIQNNTAKELTKLAGVIQVPFRAGNQFLGEGGLQDVYYDIRDKTRIIADQHADLGRTIDSSIVQHLNKLRAEIKAHIKNVQNDTGKLAAGVARERELSTKLVGELANAVSTLTNTPNAIHARNDPYIANQAVARQLQHQVYEENMLQKSIVIMQQNSAHFEEGIVQSIQSAWQTFDEWQSRASAASQDVFRSLAVHMASLRPDHEWIQFAARSDHLLDPETPLRDPEVISYPLKDHHATRAIHTGHLERKKRFTRAYRESYFVLTPAGFLHEFASSDPNTHAGQTPTFSLYLPTCTLGPASSPRAKSHKFHIEGRKDGEGTTKTGSLRGLLGGALGGGGGGTLAWSFRARSHEDMMEWWNDIRSLCARYLVASEQVDRTGPVEEAVRSVGYQSEEDEEVEEDEEEEEEGEGVQTADEGEADIMEPLPVEKPEQRGRLEARNGNHAVDGDAASRRHHQPRAAPERHVIEGEDHEGSSVEDAEGVGVNEHPVAPTAVHERAEPDVGRAESRTESGHVDVGDEEDGDGESMYAPEGEAHGDVGAGGKGEGVNGHAIQTDLESASAPAPAHDLPLHLPRQTLSLPQDQLEDAHKQIKDRTRTVQSYVPQPRRVLVGRGNSDIRSTHLEIGTGMGGGGHGHVGADVDVAPVSPEDATNATTEGGEEKASQAVGNKITGYPQTPGDLTSTSASTSILSRQTPNGESTDTEATSNNTPTHENYRGAVLDSTSHLQPYYERDDEEEEEREPTHAVHRAPTGAHVKYALLAPGTGLQRAVSCGRTNSSSATGTGTGRPRSPPPPFSGPGHATGQRQKHAPKPVSAPGHKEEEEVKEPVRGYDVDGDFGSSLPTQLESSPSSSTISSSSTMRVPVEEISSGEEDPDLDPLEDPNCPLHRYERVQRNVGPGPALLGDLDGKGGRAAAAAYAAQLAQVAGAGGKGDASPSTTAGEDVDAMKDKGKEKERHRKEGSRHSSPPVAAEKPRSSKMSMKTEEAGGWKGWLFD